MKISVTSWQDHAETISSTSFDNNPNLIIFFGDVDVLKNAAQQIHTSLPNAISIGCSTGGQIFDNIADAPIFVAAAIEFEATSVKAAQYMIGDQISSLQAGENIGTQLRADDLAGIFVLSDGLAANGSDLAKGISDAVGLHVPVVGGLAGDGERFEETFVALNGQTNTGQVVAIGMYGDKIRIGHGCQGGWKPFGPKRTISRSDGNILYELDGELALDLYEKYLGEEAANLPASALLFPLLITDPDVENSDNTRTILNINRDDKSMVFAGNMPQGSKAQFMRASHDGLIVGAAVAAQAAVDHEKNGELALMVSCIGRRLVMKQRTEEEVDAAAEVLGKDMPRIGFYSYGEICPNRIGGAPRLHNQTMTISVISESM